MQSWLKILGVVLVAASVAACSGSSATRDDTGPQPPVVTGVDLSGTETFDPSPYPDEPPRRGQVIHDVPEALMSARAGRDVRSLRTVQGYRIQIHASQERNAAMEVEEDVSVWWRGLLPEERPADYSPTELPVQMRFVTPYYRVRIGAFETRAAAEDFLAFLDGRYPDAFLVLDSITVYR